MTAAAGVLRLLALALALALALVNAQVVRNEPPPQGQGSSPLAAAAAAAQGLLRKGTKPVADLEARLGLRLKLGQYDEAVAKAMVDFSAAAYFCRSDACETWICSACQRHPRANVTRIYDAAHNGNGLVGYDPELDVIVVAFAGTDTRSTKNWIDDLDGELAPYPWGGDDGCGHCKVHKGFLATYNALRLQLLPLLQALGRQHQRSPIWVTGHSLGAALGVLCVLDLLRMSYPVQASINFGQPRAGNRELADHFHRVTQRTHVPFFRVVHARDPVPHLPPESFGFWQPPFEVYYSEHGDSYRVCDISGEDPRCSDKYLVDTSVADHLHYLGVNFGAADMEGEIAKEHMQTLDVEEMKVVVEGEGGGIVPVVEA